MVQLPTNNVQLRSLSGEKTTNGTDRTKGKLLSHFHTFPLLNPLNLKSELAEGEFALFEEFVVGGFDLGLGVVVELEPFDNAPFADAVDFDGKGGDDPGGGVVFTAGDDADGMEAAPGGGDEVADGIDHRVGGGGGRGSASGVDDGLAALSDGGDKGFLEPGFVADDFIGGLASDFGVVEIGEHAGAVVAPDAEFGDLGDGDAGLLGELGLGAVFVEAGHREELLVGDIGGAGHGDEAIGIAGVADDHDADGGFGVVIDGLALPDEDFAVDAEEVGAFHALFAGNGSNEECPVDVLEAFVEVGGLDDFGEEGEGAVVEFHGDALEGCETRLNLDEIEGDRLVGAEHRAGRDAEKEGVTDVTGGACDCDSNWIFFHKAFFVEGILIISTFP